MICFLYPPHCTPVYSISRCTPLEFVHLFYCMIYAVSSFLHSSLRCGTVTYFARRPRAPPPRTYKSLRATFRRPRQVLTTDTVDIAADAAAAAAQAEAAAAAVQAEEEAGDGAGARGSFVVGFEPPTGRCRLARELSATGVRFAKSESNSRAVL